MSAPELLVGTIIVLMGVVTLRYRDSLGRQSNELYARYGLGGNERWLRRWTICNALVGVVFLVLGLLTLSGVLVK